MIGSIGFVAGAIFGLVTMAYVAGSRRGNNDGFSCAGCKYINNEFDFDEPCAHCRRCHADQWEAKETE